MNTSKKEIRSSLKKRKRKNVEKIEERKKLCNGPRKIIRDFTLDRFITVIRNSDPILVITGAGISVSCGIPDFRSSNGLYNMIEEMSKEMDLDLPEPTCALDFDYFQDDPVPFYRVAEKLLLPTSSLIPSDTHRFIALLEKQRKLRRNYTQNIDGLEQVAGIKKCIQCHGTLTKSTCLKCKKKYSAVQVESLEKERGVPVCSKCGGVLKPDIVMFGENIPNSVKRAIERDTAAEVGCVLVIGTSMQVAPVSHMLKAVSPKVPQVLINRTEVTLLPKISEGFDLNLIGDCDIIVKYICQRLGWKLSSNHSECQDTEDDPPFPEPVLQQPNTYIFEGAQEKSNNHPANYEQEKVTCDICSITISTEEQQDCLYSCRECFDYDLCRKCYANGKNLHSLETGHSFEKEQIHII